MDYADIRRLVKLVETSNISEIEIEEGGAKVRIVKHAAATYAGNQSQMMMTPQAGYAPASAPALAAPAAPSAAPEVPARKTIDVLSPMVGTFYRAPSPEAPVYVQPGDLVKPGQVLCIVEAMKLMNEIESDVSGRIVEIGPQNAEPVEFGQMLFRIEPV